MGRVSDGRLSGFPQGHRGTRRRSATRRLAYEALESRRLLAGDAGFAAVGGEGEATPMPTFTLTDLNTGSATYNQGITPRAYLEQVSGWYFGAAT